MLGEAAAPSAAPASWTAAPGNRARGQGGESCSCSLAMRLQEKKNHVKEDGCEGKRRDDPLSLTNLPFNVQFSQKSRNQEPEHPHSSTSYMTHPSRNRRLFGAFIKKKMLQPSQTYGLNCCWNKPLLLGKLAIIHSAHLHIAINPTTEIQTLPLFVP